MDAARNIQKYSGEGKEQPRRNGQKDEYSEHG